MLKELSIKNFAIIDSLTLSLDQGLTVLTGETGAGKSIIIDALGLLVGGRGSAEYVRHGEKKAEIEGLFYLSDQHPCIQKVEEFGIEMEEGMLVLRRDIFHTGKSVCRINGKLVTIAILREIGSTVLDIHGQHEHQELMNESEHLSFLDEFAKDEILPAKINYQELYLQYHEIKKQIKQLTENEQEMVHRLDLLKFQYHEIQEAHLQIGEDERLAEERNRLSNFEKIFAAIQSSYEGLQAEQSGLDYIMHTMSHLEVAAELDEKYAKILESVTDSYYILEDVAHSLRSELEGLEYNPTRLDEIESRMNEINQLKRKYGTSIIEILEYHAKIEEEVELIQNREDRIEKLESKLQSIGADLMLEAQQLSTLRKKWAKKLEKAIHKELKELYMDKTIFEATFIKDATNHSSFMNDGLDEVIFYISTNPGEPLKPLSKVASGGELSRLMLALKTIFSKHQGITSIIFDEVDTGVSGRVAQAIAEKINKISLHSQVLCITHLPQVAAMADTHLLISKETISGRTRTEVESLEKTGVVKEIARMISGVEITDLTKKHAEEMLDIAYTLKST